MRRSIRRFEVALVAAITGGWQRCVVIVGVALRALQGDMRACQRKGRRAVIKAGRLPSVRCVAYRAVGWEGGCDVIGA